MSIFPAKLLMGLLMWTMKGDLEKIKKQLNHGGDHFVLQGPLLKRSDTVRSLSSVNVYRFFKYHSGFYNEDFTFFLYK